MSRLQYRSGKTELFALEDDFPLYAGNSFNPPRPLGLALVRGLNRRCPACGIGQLYHRYLKIIPFCRHCGEALHHARPDDAPPYFVMLIVGHIVVPIALILEETLAPPLTIAVIALFLLSCMLCLALLPPVKGVIVALQWTFWMHGFDPHEREEAGAAGTDAPQTKSARDRFHKLHRAHPNTLHALTTGMRSIRRWGRGF